MPLGLDEAVARAGEPLEPRRPLVRRECPVGEPELEALDAVVESFDRSRGAEGERFELERRQGFDLRGWIPALPRGQKRVPQWPSGSAIKSIGRPGRTQASAMWRVLWLIRS
jgi:hypothetical protein